MLKRILSLTLLCSLMFTATNSLASEKDTPILVDGQPIQTASLNSEGRVMVPPAFFQRIGVSVGWNAQKNSYILNKQDIHLALRESEGKTSFIPLRYAAENLGMEVSYDALSSTVNIDTKLADDAQAKRNEEIYWLYQLTEAEAGGESYEGKVAVASAVLNRVDSPDYPGSIKEVIFQVTRNRGVDHYQFSPVKDQRIHTVIPGKETIEAVNAALKGSDPTSGSVVFYNPQKTNNQWVRSQTVTATIGNHVFAK
ncbi:cell wall hydrolase [Ammoniphilus sp. 3BR4]|uniref:cell wall hydrolase n=1 Tax=Ammoniphilus sp. 3BR4 TaxID=3158265 RepID=UPI003466A416